MSDVGSHFGTWLEQGFDLYKRNFVVLALAGLIGGALSLVSFGLLAGPMSAGMILIVFRLIDGTDPKPQAGDIFKGFEMFLPTFLFTLVWGALLSFAVAILNVIPCIGQLLSLALILVAQVVLWFGLFLVVDRKRDFWSAVPECWKTIQPHFFPLLGITLLAGLLGSLGVIACGIGAVVTMPLSWCILSVVYRDVFRGPQQPLQPEMVSVPPDQPTA